MDESDFDALNEKTEARIWLNFFLNHTNPIVKEIGYFLSDSYGIEFLDNDTNHPLLGAGEIDQLERVEALNWQTYLEEHSHPGLRDAGLFLGEWVEFHSPQR